MPISSEDTVKAYMEFFTHLTKLKHIPRTGWVRDKIPDPESVAEHSFKAAIMAMVLADTLKMELDKEKLLKMALVHDVAESIIGDLIVFDPKGRIIPELEKAKLEKEIAAFKRIFEGIPNGDEYIALFDDFNNQKSEEARIFKELDRLENAFQAAEYESRYGLTLQTYFDSANNYVKTKRLRDLYDALVKDRQ
jgi:5'-deoxynucleotidase YfbR-like HD superfamily hydrolase